MLHKAEAKVLIALYAESTNISNSIERIKNKKCASYQPGFIERSPHGAVVAFISIVSEYDDSSGWNLFAFEFVKIVRAYFGCSAH
jgi:hypothetical protein